MATRPSSNGLKAKMSESTLTKIGLYFDSENKVRILDHQSSETTGNLLQECGDFISSAAEFKSIVDDYVKLANELREHVEAEKIKALGSQNALNSIEKRKELDRHQIAALIAEKKLQLDRLLVLEQSLSRQEAEQKELIDKLTNQH